MTYATRNHTGCTHGCLSKFHQAEKVVNNLPAANEILRSPSKAIIEAHRQAKTSLDIYMALLGSEALQHDEFLTFQVMPSGARPIQRV